MLNKIKSYAIQKLPTWFKAKLSDESSTKDFIEVFANEFSELQNKATSAYNLTNLDTFSNIDYKCHKAEVKMFKTIMADGEYIPPAFTQAEFVKAIENKDKRYYYDEAVGIIYLSTIDDKSVVTADNKAISPLLAHRVWNADVLDEFGLIYDMPRLDKEDNKEYLARLVSYKSKPANSSMHGICSYVGHSLSMYKEIEWLDGGQDINISIDDIICSFVYVDNIPYPSLRKLSDSSIRLIADKAYNGKSRKISYFYGFDVSLIQDVDSKTKDGLMDEINKKCAIMWGYARWDDMLFVDEEVDGEYHKVCPSFDDSLEWLKEQ